MNKMRRKVIEEKDESCWMGKCTNLNRVMLMQIRLRVCCIGYLVKLYMSYNAVFDQGLVRDVIPCCHPHTAIPLLEDIGIDLERSNRFLEKLKSIDS